MSGAAGRAKQPPAEGHTLARWLVVKETLPRRWPLVEVTREQVATHNTADDCWAVLQGLVFDLTAYLPYHPGGADVLLEHAGGDVTAPFREYHSWVNWERLLDGCIVGRVVN